MSCCLPVPTAAAGGVVFSIEALKAGKGQYESALQASPPEPGVGLALFFAALKQSPWLLGILSYAWLSPGGMFIMNVSLVYWILGEQA